MRKDRLILLLLVGCFALLGAECQVPWEDDDEKKDPLPDRALASSPLLRAYYNTLTIPKGMRAIKIPEKGLDGEPKELTIEYEMGGAATVTSVHTHMFIVPAHGKELQDSELVCRCIAPDGTKSAFKTLDIDLGEVFDPQVQVSFLFEFDGLISDGTWKIQVKDNLNDEDGRCLFRNGSLHINRGETAGLVGGSSETQTLDINAGNYGTLPEFKGKRIPFDYGHYGVNNLLRNEFTFASSFTVRAAVVTVTFYEYEDVDWESNGAYLIVAPSGNWSAGGFGTGDETADFPNSPPFALSLYLIGGGDTTATSDRVFNLAGEPSAGTWTLFLWDTGVDGNRAVLTDDDPISDPMSMENIADPELEMTLFGAS